MTDSHESLRPELERLVAFSTAQANRYADCVASTAKDSVERFIRSTESTDQRRDRYRLVILVTSMGIGFAVLCVLFSVTAASAFAASIGPETVITFTRIVRKI